MICFGFLLYPISEHSFHMKVIKKLFMAKTVSSFLFRVKKVKGKRAKKDSKNEKAKNLQHIPINVSLMSSTRLYIRRCLADNLPWCFKERTKLQKLYEVGQEKLEVEMDIVKIIKNLKFLRILMKQYVADEEMQFKIRHDPKNVIDLDAPTDKEEPVNSENSDGGKVEMKGVTNLDPSNEVCPDFHPNLPAVVWKSETEL